MNLVLSSYNGGIVTPNTTVLLVGIILLATRVLVRTLVEGTG